MAANVRHSSENSEFMTPQWLTDWAHHVMGGVDLDPASSEAANRTVRVGIQLDGGTVEQFAAVTSGTFQRQFAASAAGVPTTSP